MVQLIYDKFYGGISNDEYTGQAGSYFDGEGMEISRDSKAISQTCDLGNPITLLGQGIAINGNNIFTENGYIQNKNTQLPVWKTNTVNNIANFTNFNYISGGSVTQYGLIICNRYLSKYISLYDTPITGTTFTGTNWSTSGLGLKHTPGSTTSASSTFAPSISDYYKVEFNVSFYVAGSFTVSMGGYTSQSINANGSYILFIPCGSTTVLKINPTSDFDGIINTTGSNVITLSKSTVTESFADTGVNTIYRPYLQDGGFLYLANGYGIIRLDSVLFAGGGTLSNAVTINASETIKAITKIGDQIVFFADDGVKSTQYFWDGASASVTRSITRYDLNVQNLVNFGSYCLVWAVSAGNLGQTYNSIWKTDGYNRVLLYQGILSNPSSYKTGFSRDSNRIYFQGGNTNAIESSRNIMFIPGFKNIYSYGSNYPSFPQGLSKIFSYSGQTIDCMNNTGNYLEYTYNDGSLNYFYEKKFLGRRGDNNTSIFPLQDYGKYSWIETNPFVGKAGELYNLKKWIIRHKIGTGSTIALFAKINDDTTSYSFIVDTSIHPITILPTVGSVYSDTVFHGIVNSVIVLSGYTIIGITRTSNEEYASSNTLTKTSGVGDNTIIFSKMNFMKYIGKATDTSARRTVGMYPSNFQKINFGLWILNTDSTQQTYIYDLSLFFDPINDVSG